MTQEKQFSTFKESWNKLTEEEKNDKVAELAETQQLEQIISTIIQKLESIQKEKEGKII